MFAGTPRRNEKASNVTNRKDVVIVGPQISRNKLGGIRTNVHSLAIPILRSTCFVAISYIITIQFAI